MCSPPDSLFVFQWDVLNKILACGKPMMWKFIKLSKRHANNWNEREVSEFPEEKATHKAILLQHFELRKKANGLYMYKRSQRKFQQHLH